MFTPSGVKQSNVLEVLGAEDVSTKNHSKRQ